LTINTQVLSGSFDASVIGKQLKTNLCKVETGFVGTIRGEQYTCEFVVYYDEELKPKMVTPSTENSEVCASIQAIMTTLGIEA
jgi:hypothetical protein